MGIANGQFIALKKYTEAAIQFNSAARWPVDLIVAPNLVYDMILGTPFMHLYHATMTYNPSLRASLIHPKEGEVKVEATPSLATRALSFTCATLTSFESPAERATRAIAMGKCTFTAFENGTSKIALQPIREILLPFRDRFPDALPPCRPVDRFDRNHQIDLIEGKPLPQLAFYPGFNPNKLAILQAKLQSLLNAGIIVRHDGKAPACSPGFLVIKDTKARLVGDYRILNDATLPHAQDIPSTQDIIDLLGKARIFTLSDMMSGYFQLRIVEDSQHLTTFSTPLGRFKYTVTAMGLRNAGSDFQKAVRACLLTSDLLGTACFNYLDDIIIFSNTPEEHAKHVEKVLEAMRADGWYLSYDKSQVGVFKIKILGHWVEKGRVYTDPTYVGKLSEVRSPHLATNKIKALQGFLGLVGYYRRFIPDFATIAAPLTRLLRKTTEWTWGEDEERARKILTAELQKTVDKGLSIYDKDRPTRIHTDASGTGLGAVLEQQHEELGWTPIAYISKTFTPQEANLVNYERELFAIYTACKKWLCYLQGRQFTILCDCNALCNIRSMTLTNRKRRVVTMLLFLGTLSFDWQHVKGKENAFADALSRVKEPTEEIDDPTDTLMDTLPNQIEKEGEVQPRLPYEVELDEDSDFLFAIWEAKRPSTDHLCSMLPFDTDGMHPVHEPAPQNPQTWKDMGWLKRSTLAQDLQVNDDEAPPERIEDCVSMLETAYLPRDMDAEDDQETLVGEVFAIGDFGSPDECAPGRPPSLNTDMRVLETLYPLEATTPPVLPANPWDYSKDSRYAAVWKDTATGPQGHYHRDPTKRFLMIRNQYIVPAAAVPLALADVHKTYGHVALTTMVNMFKHWRLWWPDLRTDCAKYIESCLTCNLKSITNGKVFGLLGRRPAMDKTQEIAVDFAQLPSVGKFNGVLGVIDRATRFTMWIPANKTWNSRDCFTAVVHTWCGFFGLPIIVRSDNGPTFASNEWNNLWRLLGVQTSHSDPYHPQANGIIERSFGTLKSRLRAIYNEHRNVNWVDILPFIQGCHNATTRESLGGASPAEAMMGYCPRWDRLPRLPSIPKNADWLVDNDDKMTKLSKAVSDEIRKYEAEMAEYTNKSRVKWIPKVDEMVFVSRRAFNFPDNDGLNLRFLGPVAIAEMAGSHSATVIWDGKPRKIAVEYLRPCRIDSSIPQVRSTLAGLWAVLHPDRTSNTDDQGVWDAPTFMDALDEPSPDTITPSQQNRKDAEEFSRDADTPTPKAIIKKPGATGKKKNVKFASPPAANAEAPKKAKDATPQRQNETEPQADIRPSEVKSPVAPSTPKTSQNDVLDPEATWSPTRAITRHECKKGRTVFLGKWANSTKSQRMHWVDLVHLDVDEDPPEWVANGDLVNYLADFINESEEVVLDRIEVGDMVGFLEEAEFSPSWLKQMITFFPYVRKKGATKAQVGAWSNAVQRGRQKLKVTEKIFPSPPYDFSTHNPPY